MVCMAYSLYKRGSLLFKNNEDHKWASTNGAHTNSTPGTAFIQTQDHWVQAGNSVVSQ